MVIVFTGPQSACENILLLVCLQEADQFLEWRGGLAQKREVEEKARRMVEEVRVRGG